MCVFYVTRSNIFYLSDRNNIFYLGFDNPLTIVVENYSCKSIIVKTDNGTVTGNSGKYIFHSNEVGKADIILYRKINGKIKEIGRGSFRIKAIPGAIAKVGPSSGGYINKVVLGNQQFIRADYECCEGRARVDSFAICIVRGDTCLYNEIKISDRNLAKKLFRLYPELRKTIW